MIALLWQHKDTLLFLPHETSVWHVLRVLPTVTDSGSKNDMNTSIREIYYSWMVSQSGWFNTWAWFGILARIFIWEIK